MSGTLFVVATPIGNLEDISARALRVLREVAVIAAEDTRRTAKLLARHAITTPTTSLHEHNEPNKAAGLIARLVQGESAALVSDAGTPVVSDPGHRFIRGAIDAGVRVEPVPGPSAVLAALMGSGLPSGTFTFLGFPPIGSSDRNDWFDRLKSAGGTVVFFEAPHRIRETLDRLRVVSGDCQVAIARELTKAHEQWVRGPISLVVSAFEPLGELTVVVDLGQKTNNTTDEPVEDSVLLDELGQMVKSGTRRRQALTSLARRHGRNLNDVYAAIERAKKSVKSQS